MAFKPEKNFLLLDHITLLSGQCRASVMIPKMGFLWDPKVEKRENKIMKCSLGCIYSL